MNELDQRPDLFVGVADWLPDGFEADALKIISSNGASAGVLRLSGGPYGAVELYLPTAVGIFIVGAFFTGFLSKAGEDAYEVVKKGVKALCRKASRLDVKLAGSPGKVKETGYSFDFAVGCELLPDLRVKLLIPKAGSGDEIEEGVDAFLDLMRDIHAGRLGQEQLERLLPYRPVGGTVLMTYDAAAGIIVPVDGLAGTSFAAPSPEPKAEK